MVSREAYEYSCMIAHDLATMIGDEAAILDRLIRPAEKLSSAGARALLRLEFDEADRARMHALSVKNQADKLTTREKRELQSYLTVGLFLDLIHAKANLSLRGK
jgi:hypothetical protein